MPMKKKTRRKTKTRDFVRPLVQLLESIDFNEAQRAAEALGEIGDPEAIRALVAVLKRSSSVRASTIAALKRISKENDAAATELAIALLQETAEAHPAEETPESITQADRRRMPRVLMEVPVVVKWTDNKGRTHTEPSTTQVINAYGALVQLKHALNVGLDLEITNLKTRTGRRARVAWVGSLAPGGGVRVGIELDSPDPDFWLS
jgi:HEAT repeat protein